jgi:transposase
MRELYRLFKADGYQVSDIKMWAERGIVEAFLERDSDAKPLCHRCGAELTGTRGKHRMRVQGLPIGTMKTFVSFWRHKAHCPKCGKARSERIDFVAPETPHLTRLYAAWIGSLCEIAAVSRAAEFMGQDETTTWRLDFERMKRMASHYKIPHVKRISVDEVYARKKPRFAGESRDERFFTVVSDLETRRVIWVGESRTKAALDEFFTLIGEQACLEIEVVAVDQHEGYASSVKQHCKCATLVWDRFHVMQLFEEAVNDMRAQLHEEQARGSEMKKLTRGKYRFLFLKKATRRTDEERSHIDDVLKENERFAKLELIKERMLSLFDAPDENTARAIFDEVGDWIFQAGFGHLMRWHIRTDEGWNTLKNYFKYRVTSALSEGLNNVIKAIKRRAYGYRNMDYFRLKIMQVCGYLNSRYMPMRDQALTLF